MNIGKSTLGAAIFFGTVAGLNTTMTALSVTNTTSSESYFPSNSGRSGAAIPEHHDPYLYLTDNPSLSSLCGAAWSSEYSDFIATGAITSELMQSNCSNFIETLYQTEWSFTPTTPCCSACVISGWSVEVYYWPTPAPTPAVSTLVDDTGFTFVSPSVYVAFRDLGATDLCGRVGGNYQNKTLSFGELELSTTIEKYEGWEGGLLPTAEVIDTPTIPTYFWTAFNYADLYRNCTDISSAYFSFNNGGPGGTDTQKYSSFNCTATSGDCPQRYVHRYNPCHPLLSVPSGVFDLDPAWASCYNYIDAFYDPPHALEPATGLTPASTTFAPSAGSQITASPAMTGPSVSPQTPSPTTIAGPSTSPSISRGPAPLPDSLFRSASRAAAGSPAGSSAHDPTSDRSQAAGPSPAGSSAHPLQSMSNNNPLAGDPAAFDSTGLQQSAAIGDPPSLQPLNMGTVSSTPVAPTTTLGGQKPFPLTGGTADDGIRLTGDAAPVSISNTLISGSSPGVIIGDIYLTGPATTPASWPVLPFVGDQQIRFASDGAVILGTSILSPGAQLTLLGTSLSVGTGKVIIGSKTYLSPPTSASITSQPIDQQLQRTPNGDIILPGGSIIKAGGPPATIGGTVVSAIPNGAGLLINSSTIVLLPTETASQSVFTIAGHVVTVNPSRFSTGSITLLANNGEPAAVLTGTLMSLTLSGSPSGSSSVSMAPSDTGLGRLILLGMGVKAPSGVTGMINSSTASVVAFTGIASRITADGWWVMGLAFGLNMLLVLRH